MNLIQVPVQGPDCRFRLGVPKDSNFVQKQAKRPTYEPLVSWGLRELLDGESIFYDIGSRWGIYTVMAIHFGLYKHNIHCFEADEDNYKVLLQNIRDHNGSGVHSNMCRVGDGSDGSISIDGYLEDRGNESHMTPDVLKIDVEGAEYDVLLGMEDLVDSYHPSMIIEVHPDKLLSRGTSMQYLFDWLEERGYDLYSSEKWRRSLDAEFVPLDNLILNPHDVTTVRAVHSR